MHAVRVVCLGGVFSILACGDDGGRASASASQTDSASASVPMTSTVPTGGVSDTQGATTISDEGTVSDSQGQTTTTLTPTTAAVETTTSPATLTTGPDPTATTEVTLTSLSDPSTTSDESTGDPCMGSGGFDFTYLWVANTSQGSISKINTETLIEEGRYYADPNPAGASTSRTSVNIDGHYVVVSNRASYTVTKVAANVVDCVDKNGNGAIETSQNKDDLLAWGTDECVLWNVPVNPISFGYQGGPRGTAWAPGDFNPQTCKYENQKVWVGWLDTPTHATIGRFDGETGVQDATIGLDNWSQDVNVSPYGGAADGFGYVWFISAYREVIRIDSATLEVKRYPSPGIQMYGMTVDGKGNVWFGTYSNTNMAYFDAKTETFVEIPGTAENHRGIAVDGNGMVWAATNAGGTHGCGLNQVDSTTNTFVQFHTFDQCGTPVGVSIDVAGYVWMVDYSGWAYRIDPDTYEKVLVTIPGDHYTYSDMTGGGLVGAVMPG